jgi:transposase
VDRRAKVELYEQIRREYEHGGGTIRGIAKKLGIHRRMVREAVLSAVPVERKTPVRERPKLEPAMAFVDAVLEADKKAPRKQRHTAHRIWCRIRAELPEVKVAESTIRRHVRERKIALALLHRETFIPQSYVWGGEAQVDWYEAYADICGERELAYVFCMRSMASGGAFHCTFPHASQQAFLEAHERAFLYFGGVFAVLRYDNLKSAVKKILRGHQREETTRFMAFRSHWGFASEFCTPGEGHEKGGVEGEGGYFRRNHMVPVPQVASWEADHAGEKLGQERRESGEPWRRKNRPPEMNLRKRSKQERFVGYRRDVYRGAICTSSASGSGRGEKRTAGGPGVWAGAGDRSEDVAVFDSARLSTTTTGEAAEAGSVGRSD